MHAYLVTIETMCVMDAGDTLSCPVHLYNTGNVALVSSLITSPTSGCKAGLLLPFGPPADCNITVMTTQGDFEQGFVNLTVAGIAAPRPLSGPASFTWDGYGIVRLKQFGRMSAEPAGLTVTVTSAGEPSTMCWWPGQVTEEDHDLLADLHGHG